MKKNVFKSLMFLLLFLMVLASCVDSKLIGIEISKLPDKVVYEEGELFDSTGLVVEKVMSNGSKKRITDFIIDKTTALTIDDTFITIEYEDFSAKINITVEPKETPVRKLVDVEFKVDEDFVYTRTMDLSDYIKYREVYSDNTYEDWAEVEKEDLVSYSIENGELHVVANMLIKNQEWTKEISVPLNDNFISIETLLSKEVDGTNYLVNGILVAIATTMSRTEYILWDKDANLFIGIAGLATEGSINDYTLDIKGLEIGDELRLPVKLVNAKNELQNSDSKKLYAEFVGGNLLSTAIVSKNNNYQTEKNNVLVISDQTELISFLNETNRSNNFYQVVKLHGKMRYIYYSSSKHYRFFFDSDIKTLADQLIDNCSPSFANGSQYYTTGKTIGEMIFNDANFAPTQWSNPGNATKDIYALFIGGNNYYHEFVILSEDDVSEVIPILQKTDFVSPSKLAYNIGEDLELLGGKIVYTFDYGDNIEVILTNDMLKTQSLPNMTEAGEYVVEGSYGGYNFSFKVTVINKIVESLELIEDALKTNYHIRDNINSVKEEFSKMLLKVFYHDGDEEIINVTENMISFEDEWELGDLIVKINYLGKFISIAIKVENQGISVSELKEKNASDTVYDLHGIVISSAFISGTAASPANGEILIKDMITNQVIGLRGANITTNNKLAGLSVGDEILVKVNLVIATTTSTYSENGKLVANKVGEDDFIILSQNNDVMIDLNTATLVASQEHFIEFLKDAQTRAINAYTLIKLCAGAKIVGYNSTEISSYLTFTGTSAKTCEIDGIRPYLHLMNEQMTLGNDTYLNLLFGEGAINNPSFVNGNVLERDVYLMYIGGQGIYYHQFILLGKEYVSDEASKNLKEIKYTQPTKATYNLGDELDFTDGTIEYIYYYEPHNVTINLDASFITSSPINMDEVGEYTIQFTYDEKTYDYHILITSSELDYIELSSLPDKLVYSHREGLDDLDLTGGKIKLVYESGHFTYIDLTRAMLPEEDLNWKIGEVSYLVTYQEKTTTLKINYENQAISVSEFVTKTSGTYDVTGIVVGPMGSFVAAELLLKDELTMDMVGIYNTAIVGAYNALALDTSVLNVGDKVIVRITRVITTTEGVNKGKAYGNATNGATFLKYLIIDSSGYDITYDFSNANVTEISTQEDLINFINNSDRFYSYVKLVGVKAVTYSGSYRIFFGDDIKKLDDQKINTSSPYIYNGNSNWYFENGIVDYFDNNTSTSYNNPVTTEYDIYAIFVGGNAYYHCFVILDPTWFVKEA